MLPVDEDADIGTTGRGRISSTRKLVSWLENGSFDPSAVLERYLGGSHAGQKWESDDRLVQQSV